MVKDKRTRGWHEREGILTSDVEEALLSVTDVKHYVYCPRIIYFEKVLHAQPRLSSQQEESKEIHGELEERERRKGSTCLTMCKNIALATYPVNFGRRKLSLAHSKHKLGRHNSIPTKGFPVNPRLYL